MKENFKPAKDINELTDELWLKVEDKCRWLCKKDNVCYWDCKICANQYPNTVYNQYDDDFWNNFPNTRAGRCYDCKRDIDDDPVNRKLSVKQKNKKKERCMR